MRLRVDLFSGVATSASRLKLRIIAGATAHIRGTGDVEMRRLEGSVRCIRLRSTLAPINQLPPAILTEIFKSVAMLCAQHGCNWNRITEVCTRWRDIAIACSYLWTTIDFNSCGWKTYLSRTDTMPLTLTIRGPGRGVFAAFSRTFVKEVHRVRKCRLALVSAEFKTFFELLESTPPPILAILELTGEETDEKEMPIFDKHVPSLRQLGLRNIKFPWNSPCLPGLTHLSISLEGEPELSDILGMLNYTPALQSLELFGIIPRCPATIYNHHCASSPTVRLTNLSQLRLRDSKLSICAHLVTHLKFPESTQIHLASGESPNVYRLAQVVDSVAPHSLINRYKLIVDLTYGITFALQDLASPYHYPRCFSLGGIYEVNRITQSLAPVFGKWAQLTCLDISIGGESIKARHWWNDLGGMNHISDLRVRKSEKAVSLCELLHALGSSKQLPNTSSQILLPKLRRLHLIGLCTRARAKAAAQPQTMSELMQPVLQMRRSRGVGIQELRITACDLSFRGDLGSIGEFVDRLGYNEETCGHCRRVAECGGSEYEDGCSSDDEDDSLDDTDSSTDSSSSDTDSYSSDSESW